MKKGIVYALCVGLTELAGFLVGMLTRDATKIYAETISKPPLSPPGVVFPIAWTILYALMGIGLARILLADGEKKAAANILWGIQLVLNLSWCFVFFSAQSFGAALGVLIGMFIAVVLMTYKFGKVDGLAAKLQIPYIVWLCFATYLNVGVICLN